MTSFAHFNKIVVIASAIYDILDLLLIIPYRFDEYLLIFFQFDFPKVSCALEYIAIIKLGSFQSSQQEILNSKLYNAGRTV